MVCFLKQSRFVFFDVSYWFAIATGLVPLVQCLKEERLDAEAINPFLNAQARPGSASHRAGRPRQQDFLGIASDVEKPPRMSGFTTSRKQEKWVGGCTSWGAFVKGLAAFRPVLAETCKKLLDCLVLWAARHHHSERLVRGPPGQPRQICRRP